MAQVKKVVLAYSGGLDTSIIIPWLKENYNDPEIIAVSGDVGQGTELDGLEEKAIKTGASKLYIEDLTDEMVDDVIIPSMMMGAKYEDYLLGTAFARPIIAKRLVEIAKKEGADAICHGCTGKGNDQVRFELAIKRFAPEMKIIAPWREWDIKGRDEEIDYAEAHNVPLKISRETNYSKDKNLWHLSHEGLDLEDPANEAHEVLEQITIDKDTKHMKQKLAVDFADLVYNGKWFTPLREALTAFAVDTQKYVTGTVKLKLYKGNIITSSITSPCTLYSENLVTFEESDYDQKDSQGFINLWGLPDKVQALREQGKL